LRETKLYGGSLIWINASTCRTADVKRMQRGLVQHSTRLLYAADCIEIAQRLSDRGGIIAPLQRAQRTFSLIPARGLRWVSSLFRFVRTRAHFTYFLEFGSGMLNGNGFDWGSDRLFHPTRGFLHWRAFELGLGNRSLRRFSSRSLDYLAGLSAFG
jgi:hypothetical protein